MYPPMNEKGIKSAIAVQGWSWDVLEDQPCVAGDNRELYQVLDEGKSILSEEHSLREAYLSAMTKEGKCDDELLHLVYGTDEWERACSEADVEESKMLFWGGGTM